MAGIYQPGEEKVLSGAYSFLKSFIEEQTTPGLRGKLALPIVADWGPIGEFVRVRNKQAAVNIFGEVEDFDLIWADSIRPSSISIRPTQVLLYRLAGASAKKAFLILVGPSGDCIRVEAKYEGEFGNRLKVAVQPNLMDAALIDILIYLDAELVESQTGATNAELVAAFAGSEYVTLTKISDELPIPNAGTNLADGDSGKSVEATKYTDYLDKLITKKGEYGVFTLGVADAALNAAAQDWTDEQRYKGNYIKFVFGGDANRDKNKADIIQASKDANHMAVINVGSGVKWRGKTYSSSKVAVYIASLAAAMPLNYTMALYITNFDEVTVEWDQDTDLIDLIEAGTLMLSKDNDKVIIQEPVNTLTVPGPDQSSDFGKIRVVDTFDSILLAEEEAGKEWIRKQPNTNSPARRAAFCQMMKEKVFAPLAAIEVIAPDYEYMEDPLYYGQDAIYTPKRSAGHFVAGFRHQDALEKIYTYNKAK
ncbi:phage tail sheath N-terminal beta-sandwich domain-containing protein [Aneurinibacillus sp. UBA3580]|jgi:hypothetical protein|uniref:phage tail sheath N-terminal beta-sandwich domain-containing protein n=1 Tax=Aneurinibacillus sp. UBA3580 TaxID=1946041 RepID=UPI00257ED9EF|nr:phage tail sheath N-terminal beta-sandwich domain-containing protein [Aneurinibacillus sp. UBA3580]